MDTFKAQAPSHPLTKSLTRTSKKWLQARKMCDLLVQRTSWNPSFQLCMDNTLVFLFFMIVRMSRVCRHWRQVASEPRLWRTVNLSTSFVKISASPAILQQLAPERLKYVRQLFLGGWSKLTDKGIEVR